MDNFLPGTNEVFLIVIYVFFTQDTLQTKQRFMAQSTTFSL